VCPLREPDRSIAAGFSQNGKDEPAPSPVRPQMKTPPGRGRCCLASPRETRCF
jgi:hypothetical protein